MIVFAPPLIQSGAFFAFTSDQPTHEELILWPTSNYTLPRLHNEAESHEDINNFEKINWQINKSVGKSTGELIQMEINTEANINLCHILYISNATFAAFKCVLIYLSSIFLDFGSVGHTKTD